MFTCLNALFDIIVVCKVRGGYIYCIYSMIEIIQVTINSYCLVLLGERVTGIIIDIVRSRDLNPRDD